MQSQQLKQGTIVKIRWMDSKSGYGWVRNDDLPIPERINTIGYVVHNSDEILTLSTSRPLGLPAALDPVSIPWGCIDELVTISG